MVTRGIRNKNPFNIKRSLNSWLGKKKYPSDDVFEQFISMDYGLRAGIQLLRNGYLEKGYDTVRTIVPRYAPSSENNISAYCKYIVENSPLDYDTPISVNSLTFFWLCQYICRYESQYEFTYEHYINVIKKFRLW